MQAFDLSDYEMEMRDCRCNCKMKFKVWVKSKQKYFSKAHEWVDQTIVKKNVRYSEYYSKIHMSPNLGKLSNEFKREMSDDHLD